MGTVCVNKERSAADAVLHSIEKVAEPLFRIRIHTGQPSISYEKVGLVCVRSVISAARVGRNDGFKIYSAAPGRRNSLREGFF